MQIRIEDMCKGRGGVVALLGQRYQRGTRSNGHSVITLYLYTEGSPLPRFHVHSLAGEALLLEVLIAWPCSCVSHGLLL